MKDKRRRPKDYDRPGYRPKSAEYRQVSGANFIAQAVAAEGMHREQIRLLRDAGYTVVEHTSADASVFMEEKTK